MEGLYTMKWDYRFTFGKYRACRVDEVFRNGWYGKTYIAWAYYNKEDVSFTEEILNELNITDRIEKPGANPDKYRTWLTTLPSEVQDMIGEYQKNVKLGQISHKRAISRRYNAYRLARHEDSMEKACSKGRLQWKNQGH